MPGLLQIEEYTRALLDAYGTPASRVDKLVESRKDRQELFERTDLPKSFFILDEAVLRRTVGGPKVMGRQIEGPLAQGKSLALACTGPASPSRTQGRVPEGGDLPTA